jgi:hypothetical protein
MIVSFTYICYLGCKEISKELPDYMKRKMEKGRRGLW